ncbi:MAG: pilus assembly protein TadG-related protein [Notoacmeibacter sp.]
MAGYFSRFLHNKKGNVALVLAFAFPALMASVALGVDISNTLNVKTEMQDANDTAVLFAARYFKEYRKQPSLPMVQKFLEANSVHTIVAKKLSFNPQKTEFTLESKTTVKTYLMGYFGHGNTTYAALSKANLGFSETMEFALSLDTTGSMAADAKMDGLKVAATDFIDTMFDAKDRGADIKGAIVPFAQYVNVGVSRKGQSWLSVPKDIDTRVTTNICKTEKPVIGTSNCKTVCYPASTVDYPAEPGHCSTNDGVTTCSPAKPAYTVNYDASCNNMCDSVYGPEQTVCADETTGNLTTWQGCVGSRAYPLNVKDSTYTKKIPGLLDVACSVELQPLTDNRATLKDTIASLTPVGETYLPEGVMWGTRLLSPKVPFSEGKTSGKGGRPIRKVLVLMTDGMNTLSPNGEFHTDSNSALADSYTLEACAEAKANKLEVFTISFGNAVPVAVQDLLRTCASMPEYFYSAKSSLELKTAFEDIANEMLAIRLSQ